MIRDLSFDFSPAFRSQQDMRAVPFTGMGERFHCGFQSGIW